MKRVTSDIFLSDRYSRQVRSSNKKSKNSFIFEQEEIVEKHDVDKGDAINMSISMKSE